MSGMCKTRIQDVSGFVAVLGVRGGWEATRFPAGSRQPIHSRGKRVIPRSPHPLNKSLETESLTIGSYCGRRSLGFNKFFLWMYIIP